MDIATIDEGSRWTGEVFEGATRSTTSMQEVEFTDCEFRLSPSEHPWQPDNCTFDRCRFVASDLSLSKWTDCAIRSTSFAD